MKFALPLFALPLRHYIEVAQAAEANGFDTLLMPEHLVLPYPMPDTYPGTSDGVAPIVPETPTFDPWVTLGAVAACTTTIRLATSVYILPLRHPVVTNRALVTLDRISRGRVTLGAGVGWNRPEFEAAGQDFDTRGPRTDEIIGILREFWTEKVIEHHGPHYDIGPVMFEPKPVQKPGIPIEIGGDSNPAIRRAGRLGDGWQDHSAYLRGGVELLQDRLDLLHRHRREAGREDLPFEISVPGHNTWDLDEVHRLEEMGVTRVNGAQPQTGHAYGKGEDRSRVPTTVGEWTDRIKQFGDEVIAKA